jgi:hypothetical protein
MYRQTTHKFQCGAFFDAPQSVKLPTQNEFTGQIVNLQHTQNELQKTPVCFYRQLWKNDRAKSPILPFKTACFCLLGAK